MRKIKTLYVVHHSHTDIGYTDLQERVIDTQVNYISTVLEYMKDPSNQDFRWNCETLFCVEEFFKTATQAQKDEFFSLAAAGKIGLSANYLNFNDLLDTQVLDDRLDWWSEALHQHGTGFKTAMFADINGVSMGYRNVLLRHGVEFLFTNIHCHHGMYPLYQNQTPYFWENQEGKRLLVWNGEHYNLGNSLGLVPAAAKPDAGKQRSGSEDIDPQSVENLHKNLMQYLDSCESQGYAYDFIVTAVSGVFSDNAPPNPQILRCIQAYNQKYGQETSIRMVSLQELYEAIRGKVKDAPLVRGDLTDWWANGAGSTPYAVKHYLDARHRYHLCARLDKEYQEKFPEDVRTAQDNLLLYAEHTWGHSSTVSDPYSTMVLNLDMRKNSYASKAHEAASHMLDRIMFEKGDILRYYGTSGRIRAINVSGEEELMPVEFYIETRDMPDVCVTGTDGRKLTCQVSAHPRGRKITFLDHFAPGETKEYTYERREAGPVSVNTRQCYIGAERVRDIVNDYDPVTYKLPYELDIRYFHLTYGRPNGITSLIDKRTGEDLNQRQQEPLFTPIYEVTPVTYGEEAPYETAAQHVRRMCGRNMKGTNAKRYTGQLQKVVCEETGPVFTVLRFIYTLPGTVHADVIWKVYQDLPRIDITLELGKTISSDVESVYLPVGASVKDSSLYLEKGEEAFRPGIDQIPGTCMEFYMSDDGVSQIGPRGGVQTAVRDVPLLFMGSLEHHPIRLCDGSVKNNERPMYSWVMNNVWETNFKMDLSGFCEFQYSLFLTEEKDPEKAMRQLKNRLFDPFVLIIS